MGCKKKRRMADPFGLRKSKKTLTSTTGLVVHAATANMVMGTAKGLY